MSINLNLKGAQPQSVPTRFALAALTSGSVDEAYGKRSVWQMVEDFFGENEHKKVIDQLFAIVGSKDSSQFEKNILKLIELAADDKEKEALRNALRLKVEKKEGNSLVTVSIDETHIAQVEFGKSQQGSDFRPNHSLFVKERNCTADCPVYKLRNAPLAEPDFSVIDEIMGQLQSSTSHGTPYPELSGYVKDYRQGILGKDGGKVAEKSFKEMRDSLGRSINALPTLKEKKGSDVFSREEIVTQLVSSNCANGTDILEAYKALDLQAPFLSLTTDQQITFLTGDKPLFLSPNEKSFWEKFLACPKDQRAFVKQALFTVNPRLLSSLRIQLCYTNGLSKLNELQQAQFPLRFTPIRYVGEPSEFLWRIKTLPVQYQALFLINADQRYKTPLDGLGTKVATKGVINHFGHTLKIDFDRSTYSPEILSVTDSEETREVQIKFSAHHEFRQTVEGNLVGESLAYQDTSVIYKITFQKPTDLVNGKPTGLEHASVDFDPTSYQLQFGKYDTSCPNTKLEADELVDVAADELDVVAYERQGRVYAMLAESSF